MRTLISALCLFVLAFSYASAEPRLALVIGNGAYGNLGQLANPASDARLIDKSLRQAGFDVTLLVDANSQSMKRAVLDFGRRLRDAGPSAVGLFYFAGHGIQAQGANYLIPVGADLRDEADLEVEALSAYSVLSQIESAGNATNIVVLDACRNNPFQRSFRSASRGLAQIDAPRGSFIGFATSPGGVAADGDGRNSPYSAALANALLSPGLPIEQVFKRVRVEVLDRTGGRQTPWDSSSLTGDFYFVRGAGPSAPISSGPSEEETALFNRARQSGDRQLLETFLAIYPDSAYAGEARAILKQSAVAAVNPPTQVLQPGAGARSQDLLTLRIDTDWSRTSGSCPSPGKLGEVRVPLDGSPVIVDASGGRAAFRYRVAARRTGSGAVITVSPKVGSDDWRSIDIELDSLAPGTSVTEYSDTRLPNYGHCGMVNVDVRVIQ